jgi:hypothetical protein
MFTKLRRAYLALRQLLDLPSSKLDVLIAGNNHQTDVLNRKLDALIEGIANQSNLPNHKLDAVIQGIAGLADLLNRKTDALIVGSANQTDLLNRKLDALIEGIANQSNLLNHKLDAVIQGIAGLADLLNRKTDALIVGSANQTDLLNRKLDGLHEHALRLALQDHPYDLEYTRGMVALLLRTERPPFPDLEAIPQTPRPHDLSSLEALLRAGDDYARIGDFCRMYAAIWQACVRHPQKARGWAEFARRLSDRGRWNYCRIASERVFKAGPPDEPTAIAMLSALSTLAENDELASLAWNSWMEHLPAAMKAHPYALKFFIYTGESDVATSLVPHTIAQWSENAETWITASMAACETEDLQGAYDAIRRAFALDAARTLQAVTGEYGERFSTVVRALKKYDEIADWLTQRSHDYNALNVVPPWPASEAKLAVQALRRVAMERGLPSALMVTQNKSASITVGSIFSHGFALPTVLYSLVNIRVVRPWLRDYLNGGACYVTHLLPLPQNIDLFVGAGVKSIIVNVRDPRQWVLSMAAHNRIYARLVLPSWRESVLGGPQNTIDFVIRELLPDAIAWIDGWLKARERMTVHFTTFEELIRDREAFLERVLGLYDGDTRFFDRAKVFQEQSGIDYHRRLGLIDEWKDVLTREQVAHINSLIPNEFWKTFGWDA